MLVVVNEQLVKYNKLLETQNLNIDSKRFSRKQKFHQTMFFCSKLYI